MSRSFVGRPAGLFALLAVMTSVPFAGPAAASSLPGLGLFAGSLAAYLWLVRSQAPLPVRMALAALLALGPSMVEFFRAAWWSLSFHSLFVSLFGAHGLLYGAPLLWAGFVGLISLRRENPGLVRLALAALVPGALALLLSTDQLAITNRAATWIPFLLPGMAQCFEKARAFAARRPERVIAGAGGLLVLWNLLFMEQYRLRLLPSDDTVSFAQVTSNSAGLLSRAVGTPFAWPLNWIFAWRFDTSPDRWDAVADRRLFTDKRNAVATIEFGDDASPFAPDTPLLLEGFGDRRTCERGWCRDVEGEGRLLLPLQDAGRSDLTIRLRARGQGVLRFSLDETSTSVTELTEALSEVALRVPGRFVRAGVNVLSLSVAGGGRATLDRLTLERVPSPSSAR
ncbi:MAG TPA: hypothetical protein PKU70_09405 [Vicinamibacteria bacterium]|nr:hypothetical protein [Vicinamibacteria bacterium]HRB13216.1 hypothetical protein [Vicinamibacteria bacterium]